MATRPAAHYATLDAVVEHDDIIEPDDEEQDAKGDEGGSSSLLKPAIACSALSLGIGLVILILGEVYTAHPGRLRGEVEMELRCAKLSPSPHIPPGRVVCVDGAVGP